MVRAVALATLTAALLAGCGGGASGHKQDTSTAAPTATNDNSLPSFEADVAAFTGALSRWRGSVADCLAGPSVKSCLRSVKAKLVRAYDGFKASADIWLDRTRLSYTCRSWAFEVATPLVDMYAMFMTSTANLKFGTRRDISDTLNLAETLAAKEKRSVYEARNVCGAGGSGS